MLRSPIRRPFNLRLVLALVISLMAFGLTGIATLKVGGAGIRSVEEGIGTSLALLADQMQDKLDRSMFERLRELGNAARSFRSLNIAGDPDAIGAWLAQIRDPGDNYAWVGFIGTDGRVVRATNGLSEGADVSQKPWFRAALQAANITDSSDALPERPGSVSLAAEPGHAPDIAQPVLDKDGHAIGVLAAQINWSWAGEIRDSVIGTLKRNLRTDVLLLNASGTVILGPADMLGRTLHVAERAEPLMQSGVFEGRHYLFAYAKTDGYRDFGGLGWSVLVRQDAHVALAPVRTLQNQMILWGVGLSLLAALIAWAVARRIAAPLLQLAHAAQNIQRGADMTMPQLHSYAEAAVLSRSFGLLVSDLKQRENALARLNETLEAQVSERTRELAVRNQALARAYAEAENATQAKSRFLAAASHDLRQPLHAMMLFARALSRRVHGEEAPRLVGQLEDALRSLRGMFDALLNISRLDAGLIQPNLADVSAKALIERVSAGFRVEAESRGLRFISRSVDVTLRTDAALLETMLRNLVANALKFTRHGGVALVARHSGDAVAFQVVDTGPGIPEDRCGRIFDEFERAREQAGGHNEGLGLGLSIVRRYAALLGIEIRLVSRLGRGTRFSLLVPRRQEVEADDRAEHAPGLNGICRLPAGLRVLVMDDDPMIVAGLTNDLADRGCDPVGATSPAQAEALFSAEPQIDAVIMDFDLGGDETGLDFLSRMERQMLRKIPGLILTGGTDTATLATVINSRLLWLTKPADPELIAGALAGLVARQPRRAYEQDMSHAESEAAWRAR
jgi:signal transduction histidine kinase/ActR/RegA family two-component response regulator